MVRLRTVLLIGAAMIMLRASDASAQAGPPAPPSWSWWPPPFVVWYPAPRSPGARPLPAPPAATAPLPAAPAPRSTVESWPRDWTQMEDDVLALTNQRRAQGAVCGGRSFGPAGPLAPDPVLRSAAREHSRDMGAGNYFEHVSKDGRSPTDRMHAAGWAGKMGGENIYGGEKDGAPLSAAEVVEGWMESPGHCTNIMNPRYRTLGVGFASTPRSHLGNYWTQDFGG